MHRISGLEATLTRRDGTQSSVLCSASPLWSRQDDLLGCVITLTDITDRKRAEQTLARQAEPTDPRQRRPSPVRPLRQPRPARAASSLAVFNELLEQKFTISSARRRLC